MLLKPHAMVTVTMDYSLIVENITNLTLLFIGLYLLFSIGSRVDKSFNITLGMPLYQYVAGL